MTLGEGQDGGNDRESGIRGIWTGGRDVGGRFFVCFVIVVVLSLLFLCWVNFIVSTTDRNGFVTSRCV